MAGYGFDSRGQMRGYTIRDYQAGFEEGQAQIGAAVAAEWVWPYAYSLEALQRNHARPDFDPQTRHYCFLGDEMVGYAFSDIETPEEGAPPAATLEFPRLLPGHGHMAGALMERALRTLQAKGVSRVAGRVTTMCPAHVELAERYGFDIHDWGYKVYYAYEMAWGRLDIDGDTACEVDPESDLDACAGLAARWYHRPAEWCRAHLMEWIDEDVIITHAGVRRDGKLVASCMAAPNEIRPSTAAIYYIYAPDEEALRPLLARVIDRCIERGRFNVIADLIYEHRAYEHIYQVLGFQKVAGWARCELALQ